MTPPPPCLEVDRGFWTPCRGRGVDLTPMSLIQLFVYFLGGDIFKTSIARLHPQNAASWLAVSPPFPCLEFRRGFWTPCRGRGVDLTPMSLIQLFVYFLGGDIFKTSIARLHPQNAASWLALAAGRNTGGI